MLNWIQHTYQDEHDNRAPDENVRQCFCYEHNFEVSLAESDIKDNLRALGLPHDVILVKQELLMYVPGGHFDEHVDRERPLDGLVHLGTLVIAVGSDDACGGGLEVNGEIVLPTKSVEHGAAYYIPLDIPHRVRALTGGNRVVIKFGVYSTGSRPTRPAGSRPKVRRANGRKD
jgi:hypothetical protein